MKSRMGTKPLAMLLPALAFTAVLAQGGPLLPCTTTGLVAQEEQSNCIVANPGGSTVATASWTNDPTYVNTPVSATVNDYQTTLTAILNGGTSVYQQTFFVPFSDPSVLSAITAADGILTSDGATFGSPFLTSNSVSLQSSVLSYVATSPTFNTPTLIGCGITLNTTGTCSGVSVTNTLSSTGTYGPTTIMIGPDLSDEFIVQAGQLDININSDFTYDVYQNAVTTDTYLTAQSYEIDGTTGTGTVPEPGTLGLIGCGLALLALRHRRRCS